MKTLFISEDLWNLIEDEYEEPESAIVLASWSDAKKKEFKENKKKDAKALFFIQQGGSEKVISIKLRTLWKEFDNLLMKQVKDAGIPSNAVEALGSTPSSPSSSSCSSPSSSNSPSSPDSLPRKM
ncbi:hypothetical protein JRO89_XS04G0059400 [Xanthoceras sorbifolium]|uniref:Uncharacterized protein n=1 Tax=Xanthoceras sorbifolium TaxID=99658 RepID=A0ABQ8I4L2_9ROSI|nr:hypothetical protein JRO89_XS04G0059400 [Xanthoceras sorbifolium]